MKILSVFLLCILFYTSCKKKDKTEEPSPTSTTGANPGIGGDFGTFSSNYNSTEFIDNTTYLDSSVQASFYDSEYTGHVNINAGTVTVNGTTLQVFSNNHYTATNQVNLKNLSWLVSGSGTVSAGSFSYSPSHPVFTGAGNFPDTITLTNGVTFTLNGISNTNMNAFLTMGQSNVSITKTFSSTPAVINFSPSELSGFTPNTVFTIYLSLFNYSNVTFNGHKYGVNANRTHFKYGYAK